MAIPIAPYAYTQDDVRAMFETGHFYYPQVPFWDGKDIREIKAGTHVLWKVAAGRTEYCHGEVHSWEHENVVIF